MRFSIAPIVWFIKGSIYINNLILTQKVCSEVLIGVDNCAPLMINDIY